MERKPQTSRRAANDHWVRSSDSTVTSLTNCVCSIHQCLQELNLNVQKSDAFLDEENKARLGAVNRDDSLAIFLMTER